ncbi:MAG: amidase, partial [Oscillospiraceae bacterium]|nr:amidase [Oscillospiraceae bacterium]
MTIREISSCLKDGTFTSRDLVLASLKAISENDREGRGLNCVAEISPNALFEAEHADREISEGRWRGPLHGIPVLLKDNIDVRGMHTTAGSAALADLTAEKDAFIVCKLREA